MAIEMTKYLMTPCRASRSRYSLLGRGCLFLFSSSFRILFLFVRNNESSVANSLGSLGRFGDFQLPPQIEQNTVHTHKRHVSRTDKQHLSRPQTTTSTKSGYTTGQFNQQCELFQDTQ